MYIMPQVAAQALKETILDKLAASGRIESGRRVEYIETGSIAYRWKDGEYIGLRIPSVLEGEPWIVRYFSRLARFLRIGGNPCHSVYMTARETQIFLNELRMENPTLYKALGRELGIRL